MFSNPSGPTDYELVSRGPCSSTLAALSPPRLPAEALRPRPQLREVVRNARSSRRFVLAIQIAQEVAAIHADGASVGRLGLDQIGLSINGYPEISCGGLPERGGVYTAPELRTGPQVPSPTADVYALGSVLVELLSGAISTSHAGPAGLALLPYALRMILAPCLATNPVARPTSAAIATALEHHADDLRRKHAAA
jgi:hypothetical protein